eukprot:s890_g18.t1
MIIFAIKIARYTCPIFRHTSSRKKKPCRYFATMSPALDLNGSEPSLSLRGFAITQSVRCVFSRRRNDPKKYEKVLGCPKVLLQLSRDDEVHCHLFRRLG